MSATIHGTGTPALRTAAPAAMGSTTGSNRHSTAQVLTARRVRETGLPLTAALLDVRLHGLSFATPGHRGGRSYRPAAAR